MSTTFDYENLKLFYIGKEKIDGQNFAPLVYKNKDLTTHAAIIGMTGSGKTGLGISLLEEAAIDNIPSIIIDPKGDMGNLLLTFPNLQGNDFEPWIEEQDAINNGLSISELALKTAQTWKSGVEADFQNQERIQKLKDSADFTIYTPGSNAGVQISILSSFKAPSIEVLEDSELLVSLINSTVSSILSLIDEKDDSSSKEFILISSIFMNSYANQKDLSLEELITCIVTPPFSKVGIFDLETFFPKNERLKLALKLNTIIANPSFKSWIEGEPLDISNLLYDESGKAKVSIFSIAHLNDSQRMFFVSLLLNQMVSWMRRQEGTTSLKALLYMDEIFGYFPPNANPPSKQPMLTLLKQARSFGVGIILSTQNPVDIDYKGLANIGTWFIGRLQTKQDKEKVIDGLSSAVEGKIDKNEMENLLSNLEKRTFILKNINEDGIKIFQTRWTLSYLKGPITKEQIKFLMSNKNINFVSKPEIQKTKVETTNRQNSPKPLIPNLIEQKYLYTSQNESYYLQGYLVFKCSVHFADSAKNIDLTNELNYKFYLQKEASNVNFEELEELKENGFETNERVNSNYYETPIFIQNEKELKQIQKDFSDFIFRNSKLSLFKNEDLKIISKQNESLTDFKIRIQDRLNEKIDEQIEVLQEKFSKTNDSIDDKLNKLFDKLEKEQLQANTTTTDAIISIGTSLLGAFFGKSTTASTLGKVASSAKGATKILKEKSDVKYVEGEIQQLQIEKEELQKTLENEISKINEENKISNFQIEEIFIKPKRTDIFNIKLELLWKEE
jgi:DNA helicase HerA-like ATPase